MHTSVMHFSLIQFKYSEMQTLQSAASLRIIVIIPNDDLLLLDCRMNPKIFGVILVVFPKIISVVVDNESHDKVAINIK